VIHADLYRHPRYLELADQIENHSRAMGYLMDELRRTFPPDRGDDWAVQVDHRPHIVSDQHGI
jgi:hypothetical protein